MYKKKQYIIGNGFIAKKFKKYVKFLEKNNIVIYAAGVSNSSEKNEVKFNKEILKFKKFCKTNMSKVVYISTCSITDGSRSSKKYIKNKIKIENFLKKNVERYLIVRLPEIIGSKNNPYTLTNFFYSKIVYNEVFKLYENTKRNLLDIDDAIKKTFKILKKNNVQNSTINILNKNFYSPFQIVKVFEQILEKKALYKKVKLKKRSWKLKNNYYLNMNKEYLKKVLKKYYD